MNSVSQIGFKNVLTPAVEKHLWIHCSFVSVSFLFWRYNIGEVNMACRSQARIFLEISLLPEVLKQCGSTTLENIIVLRVHWCMKQRIYFKFPELRQLYYRKVVRWVGRISGMMLAREYRSTWRKIFPSNKFLKNCFGINPGLLQFGMKNDFVNV